MVIKKYTLLVAAILLIHATTFSQTTDWGWDWKDSSKVPVRSMPQYNEFLQNKYPYPPKPRNAWELGFSTGVTFLGSSVKSNANFGGGVSLRKAISHVFSVRAGYFGYFNSGTPNASIASSTNMGYKSQTHSGALDIIASLNSISSFRGNPKLDVYLLAGYSLVAHRVEIKTGVPRNDGYQIFYGLGTRNSQAGTITTFGGTEINGRNAYTLLHAYNYGGGIAYKISNKFNIALEQRFTQSLFGYDYFEGRTNASGNDVLSFTSLRFNLNLGN